MENGYAPDMLVNDSRLSAARLPIDRLRQTPIGLPRHRMPDGRVMTVQNPHQTSDLYDRTFVDRVYARPGLTLPPQPLILDIGANIGMFSLFMSDWAVDPHIIAFEPSPEAFTALSANVAEYRLPATCLPWAVGTTNGKRPTTAHTSSVVDVVSLPKILQWLDTAQVDLLRLDTACTELDVLDVLSVAEWPRIDRIIVDVYRDTEVAELRGLLIPAGYDCTVHAVGAPLGTGFTTLLAQRPVLPTPLQRRADTMLRP